MVAPISPILKYSIVCTLLTFQPIFITFVSKFIVCKVLYFKAQYLLRLRYPLRINESYIHGQRTKRHLAPLDKFLVVRRQYSHVAIAFIDVYLFQMGLNAIVNRLSVLS